MKKLLIFEDGKVIPSNGAYFSNTADLPKEELDISDEEFEKAKKDKKFMSTLTKEKKELKIIINSLDYKNG